MNNQYEYSRTLPDKLVCYGTGKGGRCGVGWNIDILVPGPFPPV
mgnify:CR=1 FL=1